MNKYFKVFLLPLLLVLMIFSCAPCSSWLEEFNNNNLKVLVYKKEINYTSRNYHHLYLKDSTEKVQVYNFTNAKMDFLNYINVGDSLVKKPNTNKITVIRNGNSKSFFIECMDYSSPPDTR
jgi:hypothetical protein